MKFSVLMQRTHSFLARGWYRIIIEPFRLSMLAKHGKGCRIGRRANLYYENTYLGDYVSIGANNLFINSRANIIIGDYVMFGPNVTVITGGHRTDLLGRKMSTVRNDEKLPENDLDIVFEGDNWIGANSTILRGVTIGIGSIIAAGAVVTKDVTPYSVWGGVPARLIKNRFSQDELEMHKEMIERTYG